MSRNLFKPKKSQVSAPRVGATPEVRREHRDAPTSPAMAYRPVPFWSWNEAMDAAEIEQQVRAIRDGGWGGAFVHARVGLTVPYLGDAWFEAVDTTVAASRDAGLAVWLYDEDTWPSGFSGGRVPAIGEAHRMKALIARPPDTPPPPHCQLLVESDGVCVYCWTAPMGNPWFYGACYADVLNPETVDHFLDDAYEAYHRRYSRHYGDLIVAQFTDEPSPIFRLGLPRGAIAYSPVVDERFRQMHGYDLLPHLAKLFVESPGAARFRLHYFRTINDLFEHHYSARIGHWCRTHGVALTGHFMAEHSLYDQLLWGTSVMQNYRHQEIPGIDCLTRSVNDILTAKQCQSVVNQYGKRRMLSELYGVSGQGLSFADRWWIGCQQIALGVNLLNPHLALYTLAGCRKRDYPPNLFYQQPWWPMNGVLDDALSRLCEQMSQGRYAAEVLVLHPNDTAAVLWRGEPSPNSGAQREDVWDHHASAAGVKEAIGRYDQSFKALLDRLVGEQRQFDLGDETILADDGQVEQVNGETRLRVGKMSYRAVVIPDMLTIRRTTLNLLRRFIAAGGTVVCSGELPNLRDGEPSTEPAKLHTGRPGVDGLSTLLPPAIQITADASLKSRLLTHVRAVDDGLLVFVTNLDRTAAGDATITTAQPFGSVERFDARTGHWSAVSEARLHVSPGQAYLYRFTRPDQPTVYRNGHLETIAAETELTGWQIVRLDDNSLTLDTAAWREAAGPWSERPLPVIAIQQRLTEIGYTGELGLRYSFNAACTGRRMQIVIEHPERYELCFNGRPICYDGLAYWRDIRWLPIDVTHLVKQGENTLEMTCRSYQPARRTALTEPAARYGTEIEAVYLVGDFAVTGELTVDTPDCPRWREYRLPPVRQYRLSRPTVAAPQPLRAGDVTEQSLPFYAGRLRYQTRLAWSAKARRLRIERLAAAVAEVAIDGRPVGHLVAEPFELILPADSGGELSITLYGTLRNLLGPHHHPEGELPAVTPHHFEPALGDNPADAVIDWAAGRFRPGDWDERYSLIAFGDLGRVMIADIA